MSAKLFNVFNILEEDLPNLRSREDFWPCRDGAGSIFGIAGKSSVELRMVGRLAQIPLRIDMVYWRSPPPSPVSVEGAQLISAKCPGTALF
jgi:hypothetical protein